MKDIDDLTPDSITLPEEFDGLPTFIVGGWVRDSLLDEESPSDVDLMVAEVTHDEMKRRGFKEIDSENNDTFAVFQDSLGREVAIAREEVSTGPSHTDFNVEPVPSDVPAAEAVERDLRRRDFTINAMALDVRWNVLHDPHGGLSALEQGTIRHVSEAFRDDPLRVLRGARFAARLDFDIAEETRLVMKEIAPQLENLPGERIRMELEKSFKESDTPRIFFDMLSLTDSLRYAFPELHDLESIPAGPPEFHKERDALHHTLLVLSEMNKRRPNDEIALLMAMAHDLGKGATPSNEFPHHYNHGENGIPIIKEMCERLSCSKEQRRAMIEASKHHMKLHDIEDLRDGTMIDLWEETRYMGRLFDLAIADSLGRIPEGEICHGKLIRRLGAARKACDDVMGRDLIDDGYDPEEMGGKEFGNLLHQKRVEKFREIENAHK